MSTTKDLLLSQFGISWALTAHHLNGLSTDECLWRPAEPCLHVREVGTGQWVADWPEHEGYAIGPPSIAWTTWHMGFWWHKAIAHLVGEAGPSARDVPWPGSAQGVQQQLGALRTQWLELLSNASAADLQAVRAHGWPIPDAPLQTTAAWLNVELMKNAAEIGVIRFLYGVRAGRAARLQTPGCPSTQTRHE